MTTTRQVTGYTVVNFHERDDPYACPNCKAFGLTWGRSDAEVRPEEYIGNIPSLAGFQVRCRYCGLEGKTELNPRLASGVGLLMIVWWMPSQPISHEMQFRSRVQIGGGYLEVECPNCHNRSLALSLNPTTLVCRLCPIEVLGVTTADPMGFVEVLWRIPTGITALVDNEAIRATQERVEATNMTRTDTIVPIGIVQCPNCGENKLEWGLIEWSDWRSWLVTGRQCYCEACGTMCEVGLVASSTFDLYWNEPRREEKAEAPTTANSILTEAGDTIYDRGEQYDKADGERSVAATLDALYAITGVCLEEWHGWLFLLLLKCVRQQNSPDYHHDSAVDAAAYAALMGEARHKAGV